MYMLHRLDMYSCRCLVGQHSTQSREVCAPAIVHSHHGSERACQGWDMNGAERALMKRIASGDTEFLSMQKC